MLGSQQTCSRMRDRRESERGEFYLYPLPNLGLRTTSLQLRFVRSELRDLKIFPNVPPPIPASITGVTPVIAAIEQTLPALKETSPTIKRLSDAVRDPVLFLPHSRLPNHMAS